MLSMGKAAKNAGLALLPMNSAIIEIDAQKTAGMKSWGVVQTLLRWFRVKLDYLFASNMLPLVAKMRAGASKNACSTETRPVIRSTSILACCAAASSSVQPD